MAHCDITSGSLFPPYLAHQNKLNYSVLCRIDIRRTSDRYPADVGPISIRRHKRRKDMCPTSTRLTFDNCGHQLLGPTSGRYQVDSDIFGWTSTRKSASFNAAPAFVFIPSRSNVIWKHFAERFRFIFAITAGLSCVLEVAQHMCAVTTQKSCTGVTNTGLVLTVILTVSDNCICTTPPRKCFANDTFVSNRQIYENNWMIIYIFRDGINCKWNGRVSLTFSDGWKRK